MDAAIDSIIVAIENDHFKNATTLCEKSLKKWPNNMQVIALKSLALWYSGHEDQSRSFALYVVQKRPKDHFTISIVERVLEFMDRFELIASLCENSLRYAYDIRIAEKLFFAYLKLHDTKKLYSIASKMYNFSKNEVYLYWAVIGLIFESRNISDKDGQVITQLAKRLMEKLMIPFEPKLEAEYKLLKIIVAQLAGDNLDILKALDLDSKFDASDNIIMTIEANIGLERFDEAKSICLYHLEKSTHLDSTLWAKFLKILNQFEDGAPIAKNLIQSFASNPDVRGFKCASIELKISSPTSYSESIPEMLFDFTLSLIRKPSTINDVIFFLKKIENRDIDAFFLKITAHLNSFTSKKDLFEMSLFFHLHRYLSLKSGINHPIDSNVITMLQEIYVDMDSLSISDEDFYSLALYRCLTMIDTFVSAPENNCSQILHFLEAISSLFDDKYVFGLLNIVISLCSGQFDRAYMTFKHLEIKCLQLDTLGYLMSDHALNLFAFSECEILCSESLQLYSSNRRDTWGLLCQSLENQSFTSVVDFYDFYNRLEKSVQHISTETNFIKMKINKLGIKELIAFVASDRALNSIKILSYSFGITFDNRDTSIFDTVDAAGNLKKCLLNLNYFNIDEAKYYHNMVNFLSHHEESRSEGIISTHLTKNTLSEKIIILMRSPFLEEDLICMSIALMDEITFTTVSSFIDKDDTVFSYEYFASISNFAIKIKEIMVVALIKLRLLKIKNIVSHCLVVHFKSQIENVKMKVEKLLETTRGSTGNYLEKVKNISDLFDRLLLLD